MLTNRRIEEFISQHRLPDKFRNLIDVHYSRLVSWAMQIHHPGEPLYVGISGAQGTGKSTLATFLQLALELGTDWRVAVLSIDDFYLTKDKRKQPVNADPGCSRYARYANACNLRRATKDS